MKANFSNILILSDIDGTFLGKHSVLVERNLKAVERFKAEGGLFTFNTGRTQDNLYAVIPTAGDIANAPVSLSNGCCLYDAREHRSILEYLLEPTSAMRAAVFIHDTFNDVGLRVSATDGFLADPTDTVAVDNINRLHPANYAFRPISEWHSDNWYKIVVVGKSDRLDEVRNILIDELGDAFLFDKSGPHLLELHRSDRSKATVIDTYRELYSKEGRHLTVYAVGDFENDYDMLRSADISACPQNALDQIKEISDIRLCSNDEGAIADLIERLEHGVCEK